MRRAALSAAGIGIASLLLGLLAGPVHSGPSRLSGGCLQAVAATSARDAWAVGARGGDPFLHPTTTFVEHWNGSRWTVSRAPGTVPPKTSYLMGVAATSPGDAWAVGVQSPGTLILHWNGSGWRRVTSPNPLVYGNQLESVIAFSEADAWAKGAGRVFHWNGTDWNETSGISGAGSTAGTGIGGSGPTDVWAFGDPGGIPAMIHWDGTSWSPFPLPNWRSQWDWVSAISASSPTDAWAVGQHKRSSGRLRTLILHWNGTGWRRVQSPNLGVNNLLTSVSDRSPTDAWATGSAWVHDGRTRFSTKGVPLILHWNGTSWQLKKAPRLKYEGGLNSVAAISSRRAWAVGCTQHSLRPPLGPHPLVLEWKGSAWKRVSSPNP